MASNKKAQILAAVMCASSIFGSYTVVSAASATANVDNDNGKITATAKNNDNQQSTITLQENNFSVSVGGAATSSLALKDGTFTLNSKNLKIDSNNGLRIYDGTNTSPTATITKAGVITGTGLTITSVNSKNQNQNAKSTVSYNQVQDFVTNGAYKTTSTVGTTGVTDSLEKWNGGELENKVSSTLNASGLTTTVQSKGADAGIENASSNKNKTISAVAYNGVTDTVYNADDKQVSKSSVGTTSIADTIYASNGSTTLASSNISKSVSGTTESGSVALTANKITTNDDETTTLTSKLNLTGDSVTLTSGSASVKVDNATGNVAITANQKGSQGYVTLSGKNVDLNTSYGLRIKNATTGNVVGGISNTGVITGTGLTVNGTGTSSIKSTNATTEAYTKNDISYNGMTTTARGGEYPSDNDNKNKTTSAVTYTGVTDTVYDDGGNLKTKSSVTTSGITNTVNDVSTGKALANSSLTTSGISNTTTDLAMTGTNEGKKMSTALYQNSNGISASATKKDENGTVGTSTLTLGGDNASLKVGRYGFAVDSNNNVSINGKNATLSGSTFTLKDATNGKTVASLGASGLSINNADGIKVGGISNTGYLMANDGMNVTDKNSSWVTIGTSTMQKDITATTTTSYAGITNKIDTTLAGNKTYTSGTVVGPTSVTTTVQGSNTTDAIYGNKNKTTSTVSATGVTDTVYNVKGNQVASSSVTTNGIVNTTTNLSIDGSTNNTMSTSIYQDKRGISASATKKDEKGTVGTSTLTLAGNSASLKVGNYGFAVDSNNNVSIAGNNATLSGSTFTLKDANGKTAILNTSGLTLKDEDGNTTGGISTTGAVTGTSLNITAKNTAGNKTTSTVGATGVTDAVYGTDGARVAYSNVGTGGISNTTSLKTTTGKIDTAINQNTSGVGISSTKYDTNNNVTDKTSLTMNGSANSITSTKYNDSNKTTETTSVSVNGGTSSITSNGSYVYGEDGKVTSYNQASMSLNGNTGTATIRGGSNTASSTLTLNEAGVALSGKNVGLNANGLTLYKDVDGVKTQYASLSAGGLSVNGTGYTTIKSTNATTGAIGQSQVSYNGVTDSFTKDDVTNSVTTNANGTTFSSTGNGSTTIKGDTIKTTNLIVNGKDIGGVATDVAGIDRNTENEDGLGYYTQIEGKTKIYNTGRFSTANGNFVVDPYGSITSKAGNYRFNMDRTNGFDLGYAATTSFTLDNTSVSLGFRNNSFILDKNGATFINANGENVSFTSINGGTITTGETVINGSSITTKDLYVDNIHLNGAITDGNGNVVGGGDLSLGADGTLDLKYNANGITNTFVSGATGVHSSFSNGTTTASSSVGYINDKNTIGIKDQVGNTSVTTTTDGTTFANGSGSTTINGGNITTTGDVTVGGDLSVGDNFKVDGATGNVTGGTYNGVQISTDKNGNAIIGGTNIGDLATNEEVNKVNDKVDAVDNKVGDISKLDKEITDNQNYKDNQNLVGAVNAEADIRRNEISRIDGQIEQLDGRVGSLENRMSDVEDRIDKVGAMSAAIANLRTMEFDLEAPTEIAIGVGQYKSETGLALGVFHYPNQDFMLSASISTSGDEVMGGIGATWKLGRKSAAEKAKDEEARRLEKAEEMKKLAQDAKVKAQAERHAKLLAEREAQKTA